LKTAASATKKFIIPQNGQVQSQGVTASQADPYQKAHVPQAKNQRVVQMSQKQVLF
jgi:hypothetical protein